MDSSFGHNDRGLKDIGCQSDKNLIVLQLAPQPPVDVPEMFTVVPPSSSTTVTPDAEGPPQTEADRESELTTTSTPARGCAHTTFTCQHGIYVRGINLGPGAVIGIY